MYELPAKQQLMAEKFLAAERLPAAEKQPVAELRLVVKMVVKRQPVHSRNYQGSGNAPVFHIYFTMQHFPPRQSPHSAVRVQQFPSPTVPAFSGSDSAIPLLNTLNIVPIFASIYKKVTEITAFGKFMSKKT